MRTVAAALLLAVVGVPASPAAQGAAADPNKEEWVSLFDGKSLNGWIPKIAGYEVGDNFANTFRVENGIIEVSYDGYGGAFKNRFGHLFYKTPFSHYRLVVEYRFLGEQVPDGPEWAFKNSGVMIHGQPAAT